MRIATPAADRSLCSVVELQEEMPAADPALLPRMIRRASAAIVAKVGRPLVVQQYEENVSGVSLTLQRYPLGEIEVVDGSASITVIDHSVAEVYLEHGTQRLGRVAGWSRGYYRDSLWAPQRAVAGHEVPLLYWAGYRRDWVDNNKVGGAFYQELLPEIPDAVREACVLTCVFNASRKPSNVAARSGGDESIRYKAGGILPQEAIDLLEGI